MDRVCQGAMWLMHIEWVSRERGVGLSTRARHKHFGDYWGALERED